MGLFDKRDRKKEKDDFDSPNESIDLNARGAGAQPHAHAAAPAPPSPGSPASAPVVAARTPPRPPGPALDSDSYGIDKAIELMRTLPSDNVELVVQVVKFSLESVGIRLPLIIEDAIQRQRDLRGRVDVLTSEISELEREIAERRAEIERHEADFRETSTVRERLELAEGHNRPTSEAVMIVDPSSGSALPRMARQTGTPGLSPVPVSAHAPAPPVLPPPKK